jgi:hypothetical protein
MNNAVNAEGERPVQLSEVAIQGRDLFFAPRVQDKTWKSVRTYTLPISTGLSTRPNVIKVTIPKAPHGFFWNLSTLKWDMKTKLIDRTGQKPADDAAIAPINNVATSMIGNMEIFIGGTSITKFEYNSYPIVCYLNILLNYSYMERYAGNLALSGYEKDVIKTEESVIISTNQGMKKRRAHFGSEAKEGNKEVFKFIDKTVPYMSKLLNYFTSCSTPLPYGLEGEITLTMKDPSFYLQMDDTQKDKGFHLDLSHLKFQMEQRELSQPTLKNFEQRLSKQNVLMRGRRLGVVKDVISKGDSSFHKYNLTSGTTCPQRIAIVFIEEEWETLPGKTPLKFATKFPGKDGKSAILNRVDVIHQGAPLEDTADDDPVTFIARMYELYQRTSGYNDGRNSGCIPLEDFSVNSFIAFFDCTKSKRASDSADIYQEEIDPPLDLHVNFTTAIDANVVMYAFLEYFTDLEITKNNDVSLWAFGKA